MTNIRKLVMSSIFAVTALSAVPAFAEDAKDEDAGSIDVEFTLAAVSDYRFRGVSLSDKKLAIQPGVTVTHDSGVYVSLWGSNVADNGGDDIELDVTIGIEKEFGAVTGNVGMVSYVYPGASNLNYVEFLGGASTKVGPATIGLNVAYAPKQSNIGGQDNVYGGVTAEIPLGEMPVTLVGSYGIEDGAFGNSKRDWSVGADIDVTGVTFGLRYIDTARTAGLAGADPTLVFSLSKSF